MKTKTRSFRALVTCALFSALPMLVLAQGNPNPNPQLDAAIAEEMALERFPGVSTVIVKNGHIVWLQSYGMADVENNVAVDDSTLFLLASISKVFTGMAGVHLSENGGLDLDADVNDHLPWPLAVPNHPSQPITMRQLMTHTAGIQDNFDIMDNYYGFPDPTLSLSDCMQRYMAPDGADYNPNTNFLSSAPGTTFEYSNIATGLSGYIVERASGIPFNAYCEQHLFAPMCMDETAWFFSEVDSARVARPYRFQGGNYLAYPHYGFADYPSGQLRSTALDMANFMIAVLNNGSFGDEEILSEAAMGMMLTPQIPSIEPEMGLNWYLEELFYSGGTAMLWGHNGGEMGSSTDFYIDPVNNIGLCVLTNGEGDAIYICDELYDFALSLPDVSGYPPGCLTTSVAETSASPTTDRELVKVIDYLGREVPMRLNTPLIKVYSDGSVERVMVVE